MATLARLTTIQQPQAAPVNEPRPSAWRSRCGLAIWALPRVAAGRPLARAALRGFAGFRVLGTTFDLLVLNSLPVATRY